MKNMKFNIIGSVALAGLGAYVASRGFKDAVEVTKMTELNILATSWAAAELATSTILFKKSIQNLRHLFKEESALNSFKNKKF